MGPIAMFGKAGFSCISFTTSGPRAENQDYYALARWQSGERNAFLLYGKDENNLSSSRIKVGEGTAVITLDTPPRNPGLNIDTTNRNNTGTEDIPNPIMILAVADGLGGQEGGKIAGEVGCRTAVKTCLLSLIEASMRTHERSGNKNSDKDEGSKDSMSEIRNSIGTETGGVKENIIYPILEKAFAEAASEVKKNGPKGCGTTLVMAVIYNGILYIAHVGDSRAYVIDGERVVYTTKDHTFVQKLLDMGALDPAEALVHPRRNMLLRALGGEKETPDLKMIDDDWDCLILCSDGIINGLGEKSILEVCKVREEEMPAFVKRMGEVADDNATLIRLNKNGL